MAQRDSGPADASSVSVVKEAVGFMHGALRQGNHCTDPVRDSTYTFVALSADRATVLDQARNPVWRVGVSEVPVHSFEIDSREMGVAVRVLAANGYPDGNRVPAIFPAQVLLGGIAAQLDPAKKVYLTGDRGVLRAAAQMGADLPVPTRHDLAEIIGNDERMGFVVLEAAESAGVATAGLVRTEYTGRYSAPITALSEAGGPFVAEGIHQLRSALSQHSDSPISAREISKITVEVDGHELPVGDALFATLMSSPESAEFRSIGSAIDPEAWRDGSLRNGYATSGLGLVVEAGVLAKSAEEVGTPHMALETASARSRSLGAGWWSRHLRPAAQKTA